MISGWCSLLRASIRAYPPLLMQTFSPLISPLWSSLSSTGPFSLLWSLFQLWLPNCFLPSFIVQTLSPSIVLFGPMYPSLSLVCSYGTVFLPFPLSHRHLFHLFLLPLHRCLYQACQICGEKCRNWSCFWFNWLLSCLFASFWLVACCTSLLPFFFLFDQLPTSRGKWQAG